LSRLVLVAGLPGAGKSTFADRFCTHVADAVHLPLDKYFFDVPADRTFVQWVQSPAAVDWPTLLEHLVRLRSEADCYTPCIDWKDSGRRLSAGGAIAHPKSRLIRGGARCYVIPGCFAFALPEAAGPSQRVYVRTPLEVIAQRNLGRALAADDAERALRELMGDGYERVRAQESRADTVVDGNGAADDAFAALCQRLAR
jgi:uridine kinase